MHADPNVAEQGFPRTYQVDERTRHAVNFLLIALTGIFVFFTISQLAGIGPRRNSLGDLIFMDLTMAGIVLWLGSGYNRRVILHPDAIEVSGWFYSRKLKFAEIRGRQTTGNSRLPYGYAYIFVPSDTGKRKLALPPALRTDQIFRDWIKTIPKVPQ
jgi:hypothetical protein